MITNDIVRPGRLDLVNLYRKHDVWSGLEGGLRATLVIFWAGLSVSEKPKKIVT